MSLIEVKGLCKRFGSLEVLKDVSFSVDEGEVVVIIGGSGCGKSVTLRSIELLEKPDGGQIFVGGREITAKGADIDSIRRQIFVVENRRGFSSGSCPTDPDHTGSGKRLWRLLTPHDIYKIEINIADGQNLVHLALILAKTVFYIRNLGGTR